MRKKLSLLLLLSFMTTGMGTALAATNPFDDVPKGDWSYEAVSELYAAGIVKGETEHEFQGDKTITRYEMSVMVARLMANEKKANAAQKKMIDKLSTEYKSDLASIGVRLDDVQKQVDRITFHPLVRLRYDTREEGGYKYGASEASTHLDDESVSYDFNRYIMFQLGVDAQIGDGWASHMKLRSASSFFQGNFATTLTAPTIPIAYMDGPIGKGKLTVGKYENTPGYGLMYSANTSGLKYDVGVGKFDSTVFYGKTVYKGDTMMMGAELKYAPTTKTNTSLLVVKGERDGYGKNDTIYSIYNGGQSWWQDDPACRTSYELGADTKLNNAIKLSGAIARSNADYDNAAHMIRLDYKEAKAAEPNTFGLFAKYAKVERLSVIKPGGSMYTNEAGWLLGADYTIAENAVLSWTYFDGHHLENSASPGNTHIKRNRIELNFGF